MRFSTVLLAGGVMVQWHPTCGNRQLEQPEEPAALPPVAQVLDEPTRFECVTDADCLNSCAYGAVNAAWYRRAEGAPGFKKCRDGCADQLAAPPRCEGGGCVAYARGPQAPYSIGPRASCTRVGAAQAARDAGAAPRCTRAEQIRQHDGRRVILIGTYQVVPTARRMPRPGERREEVQLGHVVIVLSGNATAYDSAAPQGSPAQVALGDAPRPLDEIASARQHTVEVEGRLVLAPAASEGAAIRPGPVLLQPSRVRVSD